MIALLVLFAISTQWCNGLLISPCQNTDYKCMGKFLAARSKCNPNVKGYIPQHYRVPVLHWELPYFNVSAIDRNINMYNIDQCYIGRFDYEQQRKQVVITINCPNIRIVSDRHERFYFLRKPTIDVDYRVTVRHPFYYNTIVLEAGNGNTICGTVSFTETANTYSYTTPIRSDTKKPDADIQNIINKFDRDDVYIKEKWLKYSQLINTYFINSLICRYSCNFGEY